MTGRRMETAELVAAFLARPPVPCSLCGDAVHQVPAGDEFTWADEAGSTSGVDADLRHLGNPYAVLNELSELCLVKDLPTFYAAAQQYSDLKVRLAEGGMYHQHQVFRTEHLVAWEHGEVPRHCGWPMRLAPSGWACRQCSHREA